MKATYFLPVACICAAALHSLVTAAAPPLFSGRCGLAVTAEEARNIASHGWLDEYKGIGFWYTWNASSSADLRIRGKSVPFIPMWWGSKVWSRNAAWCNNSGSTKIPAEPGSTSLAFAWSEPLGGSSCKYSMGACQGGNYSGIDGARRAAENYGGCVRGAASANRLVSTPCLNTIKPDWFRAFHDNLAGQSKTVCCSHIYASQYNGHEWDSCDLNAMTSMSKLSAQLKELAEDGTCDYHFIQEIGIGGCKAVDHTVAEQLIKNIGNAVRDIPSVYLGWFSNSKGSGGTARKTTWLFEENALTIGKAYKDMCASLHHITDGRLYALEDAVVGSTAAMWISPLYFILILAFCIFGLCMAVAILPNCSQSQTSKYDGDSAGASNLVAPVE